MRMSSTSIAQISLSPEHLQCAQLQQVLQLGDGPARVEPSQQEMGERAAAGHAGHRHCQEGQRRDASARVQLQSAQVHQLLEALRHGERKGDKQQAEMRELRAAR